MLEVQSSGVGWIMLSEGSGAESLFASCGFWYVRPFLIAWLVAASLQLLPPWPSSPMYLCPNLPLLLRTPVIKSGPNLTQ